MKPLQDAPEAEVQAALLDVTSRHKDEIQAAAPYLQAARAWLNEHRQELGEIGRALGEMESERQEYERLEAVAGDIAQGNLDNLADIMGATGGDYSRLRFLMQSARNSRAQSLRGSGKRQAETLQQAIKTLAGWSDTTAKAAWGSLYAMLDAEGAFPEEVADGDDMRKWSIKYVDGNGKQRHITFGGFQNALTQARKRSLSR